MRRRLILMRHAKSSWKSDAPTDHARPLNKRGRRAAPAVGRHLESIGWAPELIVSSDSQRTTSTCELMTGAMRCDPGVRFDKSLYHAGVREVSASLASVDESIRTVLMLGHNPGWEAATFALCGEHLILKTGDAALLEAEADDWASMIDGTRLFDLIAVVSAREVTPSKVETPSQPASTP